MKIVEKRERKSNAKTRAEAAMKIIESGVDLDSRLMQLRSSINFQLTLELTRSLHSVKDYSLYFITM